MSGIPDEVIEQVRDAADLVTLLSPHVELKRTGSDYRGPCPFHGGTHRNFVVIPKKQMFYCFVCHEAGDVFTFFMKKFGMDYPTAVRDVAAKVGIVIPDRGSATPDPREPLYEVLALAADWYARRLREGPDAAGAREYLEQRGFSLSALLPLGLGFAPKGAAFPDAMRQLGVADDRLLDAGLLARRDDGSLRPRFWNRLLFPIHDLRGRVVGFGGRILGEGEPKYLNSPDSAVFHKGRLLYNLHQAKQAIRQTEDAVVVEGYFDALRLLELGVEQVVAPLGTAFTPDQAVLLKRFTAHVTLCYDGDAAGLRAAFRAGDELLRAGLRVSIATPQPGQDPDTLGRAAGAAGVRAILEDAVDVLERKLQLLERKGWLAAVAGRRRALDRLLPTLRATQEPVMRDLYVGRVAEALGISRAAVTGEVETARAPGLGRPVVVTDAPPPVRRSSHGPERVLVSLMLHQPSLRDRVAPLVPDRTALREPERQAFDLLVAAGAETASDLVARSEEPVRGLLVELLAEQWGGMDLEAVVEGAINLLDSRRLEAERETLKRSLPFAAEAERADLVRRVDSLSRQIAKLKPGGWNVIRTGRSGAR